METKDIKDIEVVALSLGRRFSGINASMLAVMPEQAKLVNIVGMGFNIDFNGIKTIRFRDFLFKCWRDKWRIWHARRNIDMLVGIILKYIFRYKIILVFTSVAQRHHKKLTKFYINRMEAVICPSEISAKYLERPPYIVPHGVNTEVFYPAGNKAQEWQNRKLPGKYGIGIFGRIRKSKGTYEFIEAVIAMLIKYPDWTAVVIGEATPKDLEFKKQLEQMVKQAGLSERIIFTGFIKNSKEIQSWYRALDIVVCASHKEGFGLPALEAMASKCAVIATKAGAWPEIISDAQNAYLIEPKSSQQIAEKLDILMSDDKLRYEIAQNGYDLVSSKYKIQNEAEGIQKVYNTLLAKKRS
ncbi:glycosyltransferase family 4 protein [Francisella noatunensis]|uniref:Glycosyltransferase family 4 protein n=1 Tax=Francisella noatunensis TaxID=657445 RepID=A0A9Q2KT47_9GAMM|nr:glycosyltransferase family 4 protein [Francisella noatunensis]MBK2028334.1 glycosyltransferase family 4 protein [Francisella noatunensis]MBK2034445.1 glycosyltransferase family 4 protein [Francisella noatunensis]MBK2049047.1 glycosyltransferase family 4 protein [Francisella noatunensis]MBK2049782.1 glycosyltransferase family 4 protein [Francisella noatunensis]MBK2051974.1 glycosyltransferase family 4 protein [Francisella noatunensis]